MVRNSILKAEYDLDHLPHQTLYGDYSNTEVPMNQNSQIITKIKPKIRIIHIIAPEIIDTDVKNFRALVQRLTGKPDITITGSKKTITETNFPAPAPAIPRESGQEAHTAGLVDNMLGSHVVKKEWGSSSNTNTYFDCLVDHDEEDDIFSSRWFDFDLYQQ